MSAVVHQAQHPTLSHGERVSPQATGEGVRRPLFPLTFPPTPPRSRIRLTRTASSESPHPAASQPPSPHGRGLGAVPLRPIEAEDWGAHLIAACGIEGSANFLQHPVEPAAHLIVGEADFDVAGRFDFRSPHRVEFDLLHVVFPVELNSQPCRLAGKIGNAACDRHLSTELPAVEMAVAQLLPEQILRGSALSAKAACRHLGEVRHDGVSVLRNEDTQTLRRRTPSLGCFAATLSLRERISETAS